MINPESQFVAKPEKQNADLESLSQEELLDLKVWLHSQINLHEVPDPTYAQELKERLEAVEEMLLEN